MTTKKQLIKCKQVAEQTKAIFLYQDKNENKNIAFVCSATCLHLISCFFVVISGRYRSSPLWNYFTPPLLNDKFARCNICLQEKSMGSVDPAKRSLNNLKSHIKNKHKTEWEYLSMELQQRKIFYIKN
jgi:hypothetical protein